MQYLRVGLRKGCGTYLSEWVNPWGTSKCSTLYMSLGHEGEVIWGRSESGGLRIKHLTLYYMTKCSDTLYFNWGCISLIERIKYFLTQIPISLVRGCTLDVSSPLAFCMRIYCARLAAATLLIDDSVQPTNCDLPPASRDHVFRVPTLGLRQLVAQPNGCQFMGDATVAS